MNIYSIPALINFITTVCLALFVLQKGRNYIANKAFALAMVSVGVMELGNFMALNSSSHLKILFWVRISAMALVQFHGISMKSMSC